MPYANYHECAECHQPILQGQDVVFRAVSDEPHHIAYFRAVHVKCALGLLDDPCEGMSA